MFPRGTDRSSLSKSASFAISKASSIQTKLRYPFGTVVDASFKTSSNPRKRIFCPVGLKVISRGEVVLCHKCETPNFSCAHLSCAKVESRWVFITCLTTSRLLFSYFIIRNMKLSAVVALFLLPLPPFSTLYLFLQFQNFQENYLQYLSLINNHEIRLFFLAICH